MKKMIACLGLIGCLLSVSVQASVGVKTMVVEYQGRPVDVMVWYPSEASPTEHFGYYDLVKGQAIFNAPVQARHHPLVVFSHGLGMCSYQSVFLMEHLAENGYIVAAPDHDDAAMCHIGGGSDISNCQLTKATLKSMGNLDKNVQELFPDKLHFLMDPKYRPQQISAVIDGLLASAEFGALINPNQIGVMGHSFGGWTAEALAGAEIDCRDPESYAPSVCEAPDQYLSTSVNLKKVCCQSQYRGQISNFRDDRVKAVLALGPGSFIFPNYQSLNTQVPVMILMGDHFEVDYQQNGFQAVNAMNPPTFLVVWRNVGHMTVSDLAYARPGAPFLRQFWCYGTKKKLYQNWSLGFFRRWLENDDSLFWDNLHRPCRLRLYYSST